MKKLFGRRSSSVSEKSTLRREIAAVKSSFALGSTDALGLGHSSKSFNTELLATAGAAPVGGRANASFPTPTPQNKHWKNPLAAWESATPPTNQHSQVQNRNWGEITRTAQAQSPHLAQPNNSQPIVAKAQQHQDKHNTHRASAKPDNNNNNDDDSFAPDTSWEDGTFDSFNTQNTTRTETSSSLRSVVGAWSSKELNEFGFSKVRRNEAFLRNQSPPPDNFDRQKLVDKLASAQNTGFRFRPKQ